MTNEVSVFRLNLLRAMYLLIAVGMGAQIWPLFLHSQLEVEHMKGVVRAMLAALTLVCVLGVFQPLKMLPLLFFEFAWKTIWVAAIGLPLWLAHRLDADTAETMKATLMGVVLCPLVIPWAYVVRHYLRAPGERWTSPRRRPAAAPASAEA
jgi:hypothetical protein